MALRRSEEFRHEAVRLALTSGLTRTQVAADLGVGLLTLNKWVQKHQHDDLMSGPHDDLEKENARLRRENRLLKGRTGFSRRRGTSSRAKDEAVCIHRGLEEGLADRASLPCAAGDVARVSRLAVPSDEPASAG